jgi:hypothetical protein
MMVLSLKTAVDASPWISSGFDVIEPSVQDWFD